MIRRRAFALMVVLFLVVVLLMLAGMLVERSRFGSRLQLEGQSQAAALWAAQSGVNYALAQWTADRTWQGDVTNYPIPGSDASFSIQFGPSASVNNLGQLIAADSELGSASVPPDRAYLVVNGQCNGRTQRLCTLVGPAGLSPTHLNPNAILASGNISMDGEILIRGIRSSDDTTPVDANLVTTSTGVSNAIQATGGSVWVGGRVQSNGSSDSINPSNIVSTQGFDFDTALIPPPNPDIPGRVSARSGATTPTLTPGVTTLGAGDFYFPGGLNYDGDLQLDGSNLYVQGPVTLSGSISGRGSVFVNGNAVLTGSADITAADPLGLGVYVEGDLHMRGVDGQQYLQDLATATGNLEQLRATNTMIRELNAAITQPNATANGTNTFTLPYSTISRRFSNVGGFLPYNSSDFDALVDLLGHGQNFADGQVIGSGPESFVVGATTRNSLASLRAIVQADTSSANATQASFVLKRFDQLIDPSGNGLLGHHSGGVTQAINSLETALTTGGTARLADALNDTWEDSLLLGNANLLANRERMRQRLTYAVSTLAENLGSASIRGSIYCRGNLTCDQDLQVLGSVVAAGPNSNINLRNTRVTYVQETVSQAGSSLGLMGVRCWYRR